MVFAGNGGGVQQAEVRCRVAHDALSSLRLKFKQRTQLFGKVPLPLTMAEDGLHSLFLVAFGKYSEVGEFLISALTPEAALLDGMVHPSRHQHRLDELVAPLIARVSHH